MRILHLDAGKEMRGGQRQVLMLLRGLKEFSVDSRLLAAEGSPLWQSAQVDGFPVEDLTARSVWKHSRKFDLVHAHDARSHTFSAVASQVAFAVSRRVAFPVKRSWLSSWKYKRAARYLAVSDFVAGELRAAGVPPAKIDVVYDGVEIEACLPAESSHRPLVVALATRDRDKGRDLIEQASAIANVPVCFSQDLATDLRRASVFVYISRSEGLGSAALRAMSLGVPVIASRVGGLPEVVTDGRSGLLVENETGQIAAAIVKIIGTPEFGQTLGRQGRLDVQQNFSAAHMVEKTMESYRRILEIG